MKSIKLHFCSLMLLAACLLAPVQSMAQWSIGASYQLRSESPKKGFGLRLERNILTKLPIVDIGLRAHFSYFNEDNSIRINAQDTPGNSKVYDYGLSATGGVPLGFLEPYVGIGIGNSHAEFNGDQNGQNFDDSKIFWNSFVGAALTPIPVLHPFIEYRFQPSNEADFAPGSNSNGRLILGLNLKF